MGRGRAARGRGASGGLVASTTVLMATLLVAGQGCRSEPASVSLAPSASAPADNDAARATASSLRFGVAPEGERRFAADDDAFAAALVAVAAGDASVRAESNGLRLTLLRKGSVLEALGLADGDVLLQIGGKALGGPGDLAALYAEVRALAPGQVVQLSLERAGSRVELSYRLVARGTLSAPSNVVVEAPLPFEVTNARVERARLSPAERDELLGDADRLARTLRVVPQLSDGAMVGYRVFGVRAESPLAKLGLQNGDVLLSVNGHRLTSPERVAELQARLRAAREVEVLLSRANAPVVLSIKVADIPSP